MSVKLLHISHIFDINWSNKYLADKLMKIFKKEGLNIDERTWKD